MESALRFVSNVKPGEWHNATPCSEWDLRELVNHITSENLWIVEILGGKTMEEVGDSLEGDLVGDDPIAAFSHSVESAMAVLSPAALDGKYTLSFGEYSGWEYTSQLFMDHVIHSWDIAKGARLDATLDPELVEAAIPVAEEMVAFAGEGSAFGYKQQTGSGASLHERLLAVVGRREDWAPPAR